MAPTAVEPPAFFVTSEQYSNPHGYQNATFDVDVLGNTDIVNAAKVDGVVFHHSIWTTLGDYVGQGRDSVVTDSSGSVVASFEDVTIDVAGFSKFESYIGLLDQFGIALNQDNTPAVMQFRVLTTGGKALWSGTRQGIQKPYHMAIELHGLHTIVLEWRTTDTWSGITGAWCNPVLVS